MKVAIIDYGMGNLYSVCNTFASLGIKADIINDHRLTLGYDKLILPGVGAFGDAMAELDKRGFTGAIKEFVALGRPFLGICLGMQLLLEKSQEAKAYEALALYRERCAVFPPGLNALTWAGIKLKSPAKV